MSERARGQWLLGLVLTGAVVTGLLAVDAVGPSSPASSTPEAQAASGAWYCPHGGGEGWSGSVAIANPGTEPVDVRVTSYGPEAATDPERVTVAPGTTEKVDVRVEARGSSSMVEYFGGWVAAGWVMSAGGEESGVSAEPCVAEAGRWFAMPDGTTDRGHTAYVIVMNPFSADAVFTVTVYTQARKPLVVGEWRDFVLRPRHSVAFQLNDAVAGEGAVGAVVEASHGRVASASLGTLASGGIRAVRGIPREAERSLMPGGLDTNTAMVAVLNPGASHVSLNGTVLTDDSEQTGAGIQNQTVEPASARTFSVITSSPSSLDLVGDFEIEGGGFTATRRTFGVAGDFGASAGVQEPAPRWVVLPAVTEPPYDPRLLLTNPTDQEAKVELRLLGPDGASTRVTVPARRTVLVPTDFTKKAPTAAVLVEASQAQVAPVFVAYSRDDVDYAVSVGVPAP